MASDNLQRLHDDTDGAAFLEFTVFAAFFFTLLFGIVDFTLAFYQWNAGTKAVQVGARLAAVSDPVTSDLVMASWDVGEDYIPGDLVDISDGFTIVCSGPKGDEEGKCNDAVDDYNADAMNTLVYGRGNNGPDCDGEAPNIGMCHLFWLVKPENVRVTYTYTGLGYAGRPGGPVPTIRVELVGIPFHFFFLSGLMGFDDIEIPGLASTMTGEDMSISGG